MRVKDTAENAERCACPGCPTYNECMRESAEALYCARGVTGCEAPAASCVCGRCTVWTNNSLDAYYFCLQGAAE